MIKKETSDIDKILDLCLSGLLDPVLFSGLGFYAGFNAETKRLHAASTKAGDEAKPCSCGEGSPDTQFFSVEDIFSLNFFLAPCMIDTALSSSAIQHFKSFRDLLALAKEAEAFEDFNILNVESFEELQPFNKFMVKIACIGDSLNYIRPIPAEDSSSLVKSQTGADALAAISKFRQETRSFASLAEFNPNTSGEYVFAAFNSFTSLESPMWDLFTIAEAERKETSFDDAVDKTLNIYLMLALLARRFIASVYSLNPKYKSAAMAKDVFFLTLNEFDRIEELGFEVDEVCRFDFSTIEEIDLALMLIKSHSAKSKPEDHVPLVTEVKELWFTPAFRAFEVLKK